MSFNPDIALGDSVQQLAVEHVFAVSRKVIVNQRASPSTKGKSFDMLPLRHNRPDRKGHGSRFDFGIADGHFGNSQRSSEVAFQQQWGGRERRRNVVESE